MIPGDAPPTPEPNRVVTSRGGAGRRGSVATITRRTAVGALATTGLGFALFGPRQAQEAPAGRVVIDYWEKWTGQEGAAMQAVVDRINSLQSRIYVRYFSMSAIDQKALVSMAGGAPPDLIGLWNFSLPQFVEAGALADLAVLDRQHADAVSRAFADEYGLAPADSVLAPEYYAPQVWRLNFHNSLIAGMVNTCSTMGLYYNRAAFRDVGLDPEDPPKTIAELDEAADRLTTYKPGSSTDSPRLDRAGFLHREPGWWNWLWGYHFGGKLYDPETNTATAAAPENVRGYEWLQSYPKKYGTDTLVSFQSGFGGYNSVQQALLSDQVAMTLHGSFLANVIQRFKPDFDYAAAPFPVAAEIYDPTQPVGLIESDTLCIPSAARHPREAYEFLRFTQRRENVERLARLHAKPSPLRYSPPSFAEGHTNKYIEIHNRIAQSERAFPKPLTRVWPQYEQEFNAEIAKFWRAEIPAKDILTEIERRAQGMLDRAAAKRARRDKANA